MQPSAIGDAVDTALGRVHRDDPVLPASGGPAGNARLTAWLGLLLLVLFVAECVTLLSLHELISWHIVLGTLLVPLVIAKTGVTGWRIVRYYSGAEAYRRAGPPPLLLRLLGPLAVLTGLAVLGTGLALVAVGRAFSPLATVGGFRVDALTLHKAAFVLWLGVVGLHTLLRLVPALRLVAGRTAATPVPGPRARVGLLVATVALGVIAGLVVLDYSGAWTSGDDRGHDAGRFLEH